MCYESLAAAMQKHSHQEKPPGYFTKFTYKKGVIYLTAAIYYIATFAVILYEPFLGICETFEQNHGDGTNYGFGNPAYVDDPCRFTRSSKLLGVSLILAFAYYVCLKWLNLLVGKWWLSTTNQLHWFFIIQTFSFFCYVIFDQYYIHFFINGFQKLFTVVKSWRMQVWASDCHIRCSWWRHWLGTSVGR